MSTVPPPLRVLLVDHDDDALILSRRLIEKADPNAIVFTVHSGREAMSYLLRATNPVDRTTLMPAVILLDLNMPDMSGFEVLRWIRHNRSLSDLKVIMLSRSEEASDIKKAAELGAHGYLIKYPNPSRLAAMLKQATGDPSVMKSQPEVA